MVTGAALQIAGIIQSVKSLLDVRAYFNLPSIWQVIIKWIDEYPKFGSNKSVDIGLEETCTISDQYSLEIFVKEDDSSWPLNDRVNLLAEKMAFIGNLLKEETRQRENTIHELERDIKSDIKKVEETNRNELKQLHVGDFTPTIIGLVWIAFGVILATIGSL